MCARSVICRSPPCHDSTRSPMPLQLRGLEDRRDAALAGMAGPLPQRLGDRGRSARRRRRQASSAVSPKNIVAAAARTMPGAVRLVERLQQAQPVLGGVGAEDVGVAGVHRGDARRRTARRSTRGRPCGSRRSPRCRRRSSGSPSNVAPLASSAPMSAARSSGMCVRRSSIGIGSGPACGGTCLGARPAAGTARRDGAPVQPVTLCGAPRPRARRSAGRRAAAPRSTACRRSHQRRRRCASWCRASSARPRLSAALQIGDDVAAAERVDRLLRVADQDQRGAAGERAVDHLPLHRVGVLELVDHHDRPAPMHPQLGRRVVGVQRVGQPGEQVVVAEDAALPLADLQLGQNVFREVDAHRGARVRGRVLRPQLGRAGA